MVCDSDMLVDDFETGEMHLDEETGEQIKAVNVTVLEGLGTTNEETGEPEAFRLKEPTEESIDSSSRRKKPFQIPRSALLQEEEEESEGARSVALVPTTSTPTEIVKPQSEGKTCCIEEHVGRASQNMNPAVFLLPTLFLFPAWATVFCVVLELMIHMWAHRKNWMRSAVVAVGSNAPSVLYRSPLNAITSEFCAYCQSDKLMITIGKLQDERKTKLDNRKLRYCAYVERMSVVT